MSVVARIAGCAFVVAFVLLALHASRFWPNGVTLEWLGRDDWFHRALPAEARAWSILLWAGACIALLSLAEMLRARLARLG